MADVSLSQARAHLDALVRRAAVDRERVTITNRGRAAAVLINAEELADLEEALGLAHFRAQQSAGACLLISHAEVQQKLGVTPRTARAGSRSA
jgi:prevent-host-death family protein